MKRLKKMVKYAFLLGIALVLLLLTYNGQAYAASVTINTVDYTNENIVVNNNGNARIYFATENDAARNSWETMPADVGAISTIDFSWVSPTVEQVIVVKGEDGVAHRVTLRERARKLEVSISYDRMATLAKTDTIAHMLNIMSSAGTGESPITFSELEWRKGENGAWRDTDNPATPKDILTVAQLEKLQIKGADLYFRIKAVNDTSAKDGTKGRRVSKEVRLKIAKKASPVVIGIDGEDFTADIRYGKEYRVTTGGVTTNWVKVTDKSIREVPLAVILNDGSNGLTAAKAFPAMFIEIRDYATARAAASKITEIQLKAQRILTGNIVKGVAPDDADSSDPNMYISYNGSANISITIPAASTDNPYQYCIVKPGDVFDNERVSWSTITRSSAVKVLSSRAVEGSEIFIRQKEIKSKLATRTTPAVDYELASTYLKHKVEYPAVPVVEQKSFTFIKGISDDLIFNIKLNIVGKLPYETEIRSIKLGTRELTFTSTTNLTGTPVPTTEYNIEVTLDSDYLNDLPNSYSRALYITFENGTVDKTAIKLTIQSPTPASAITASASKGKAAGTTSIRVYTTVRAGNKLVYTRTGTKVEGLHTENVITGTDFVDQADIAVNVGEYVTVYEINDTNNKVVRYKCIQITSLYINP
ncbi:MAG: hypothetical protein EWM47_11440 [Anaerolineaceae bacterium]|nr:MAG: hypothetical protein EWM47_11440 [Anaerolineaceae bacterium]